MSPSITILLVLFTPLVGGLIAYFGKEKTGAIASLGVGIGLVFSIFLFFQSNLGVHLSFNWLPHLSDFSFYLDKTNKALICVVYLVAFLVHLYSGEYMRWSEGQNRFFAILGIFVFAMVGLLLANHLLLLFVFWEIVGLCSYLLIGFWYKKEGVPQASRQIFLINRFADLCLFSGILILLGSGNNLLFTGLSTEWQLLPAILVCIGAFGKSAQLPFSAWLPRAMVGPTPVSALIHAATMVAAGVYLLFEIAPALPYEAKMLIVFVAWLTFLYGAICALFQNSLKAILAYSTISQLGYMVLAVGVGSETSAVFHLVTHAFFKAGLFLAAGIIISSFQTEDIRKMGGFWKKAPLTAVFFFIFGASLAGLPFTSGFMSKDGILAAIWAWSENQSSIAQIVPVFLLIGSILTSLYVFRIIWLVFIRGNRSDSQVYFPLSYRFTLGILSVLSIWVLFDWNPFSHIPKFTHFIGLKNGVEISNSILISSVIASLAGLFMAYVFYVKSSKKGIQSKMLEEGVYLGFLYEKLGKLANSLAFNIYQLDSKIIDKIVDKTAFLTRKIAKKFYHIEKSVIAKSADALGVLVVVFSKITHFFDKWGTDGVVNASANASELVGGQLAKMNAKQIQVQLFWLLAVLLILVGWLFLWA